MVGVRDSRADTTGPIIGAVEERGERALVALAVALGAEGVGGPLSAAEAELTKHAEGVPVPGQVADDARDAIVAGGDSLGAEFYRLR
jgi:hypothetical protein